MPDIWMPKASDFGAVIIFILLFYLQHAHSSCWCADKDVHASPKVLRSRAVVKAHLEPQQAKSMLSPPSRMPLFSSLSISTDENKLWPHLSVLPI